MTVYDALDVWEGLVDLQYGNIGFIRGQWQVKNVHENRTGYEPGNG